MGKVKTQQVIKALQKLKDKLGGVYKIDKMLLFGSRARGSELLTSDVDLMVISSDFKGIRFIDRPDAFLQKWKLPVDLEIFCYSPEEFNRKKKQICIVQEALKYGKEI